MVLTKTNIIASAHGQLDLHKMKSTIGIETRSEAKNVSYSCTCMKNAKTCIRVLIRFADVWHDLWDPLGSVIGHSHCFRRVV